MAFEQSCLFLGIEHFFSLEYYAHNRKTKVCMYEKHIQKDTFVVQLVSYSYADEAIYLLGSRN
jgi:hypothetical protein